MYKHVSLDSLEDLEQWSMRMKTNRIDSIYSGMRKTGKIHYINTIMKIKKDITYMATVVL